MRTHVCTCVHTHVGDCVFRAAERRVDGTVDVLGARDRETDKGTTQFATKCVFKDGSHVPRSSSTVRPLLCALCMRVCASLSFLRAPPPAVHPCGPRSLFISVFLSRPASRRRHSLFLPPSLFPRRPTRRRRSDSNARTLVVVNAYLLR